MKEFDYEAAWKEIALPAYKQLTKPVLDLIQETAKAAADLSQDSNCDMVWPEDGKKLRRMFDALDSPTLANASHVVQSYGHWRPSASIAGDAPKLEGGTHWKFSNYADQVLRNRFNIPNRDSGAMVSFQIHEGTIRLCYSSRDMWTWHEVSPATEDGMKVASQIADTLRRKLATKSSQQGRDSIAWRFMEEIKTTVAWPGFDTGKYMVEKSDLEMRQAARMPKPDKAKLVAEIKSNFDAKLSSMTTERDGMLWLVENDLPTQNCIYYNHTGRFCFGWREPIANETRPALLAQLSRFPFLYDVK